MRLFYLIPVLALTLPGAAAAETLYAPGYKNVTLYSLDGPPEPINLQTPAPRAYTPPVAQEVAPVDASVETTDAVDAAPEINTGVDWSGRANLGASLQTGNTEQDAINADATLKAKWGENEAHRATLKAEYNRETEDDERTEDNKMIEGQYDYFFAEKWFTNTQVSFEQDEIDLIDLRTTAGVGLGYQPYDQDDLHLQFVLGPSYLRTEYEDGDSDDSLAARWALDYDQKVWDEALQLFHEHEFLVPTDDTEDFLFDSKTGVRVPLKKGLVATGEVDFEWDNKPEPGIVEDDTTYAIKLGYEWD